MCTAAEADSTRHWQCLDCRCTLQMDAMLGLRLLAPAFIFTPVWNHHHHYLGSVERTEVDGDAAQRGLLW